MATTAVATNPNMRPDYEVSLLLKPDKVLSATHELTDAIKSAFDVDPTVIMTNLQFLDTNQKDLYSSGWSARIRKFDNEKKLELTYKKRYAVVGNNISGSLNEANGDGFDDTAKNYEAQVELGYEEKALSVSYKEKKSDGGIGSTNLPGEEASRDMLIDKAPGKFKKWEPKNGQSNRWAPKNWGTSALKESRIFGPVLMSRAVGSWHNIKLYIEIWPLRDSTGTGTEYFVEASFKTESETTASVEKSELAAYLMNKDWLLPEDSSMTGLIMARYG